MEALVEKLCQRFKLSTEERQWRDLAFCLSLFNYNERTLRKLIENLDCYKDKLHCNGVMQCFNTIMTNASKMAKNEVKVRLKEQKQKLVTKCRIQIAPLSETNRNFFMGVIYGYGNFFYFQYLIVSVTDTKFHDIPITPTNN